MTEAKKLTPLSLGPVSPDGSPNLVIIKSEDVYRNFLRVTVHTVRSRRFNGKMTPEYQREILATGASGSAAVVLPYDPQRDMVILNEQLRLPSYIAGCSNGWMLETVAGLIETGATPEETARRESLEECGHEIKRLQKIACYMPSPGCLSEVIHLFIGEVTITENSNATWGLEEEHEDIRSIALDFKEALHLADEGRIQNANCILALNWLARHHEKLRAEWLSAIPPV